MRFEKLSNHNLNIYLDYLEKAISEEPDLMFAQALDREGIKLRVNDGFYQNTPSILAISEGNEVMGRIEYHFYGCLQDGYRMAYVDWVYVLPKYRHQGIAQGLFKEFEKDCRAKNIDQYYLIMAENNNAVKFYHSFENAEIKKHTLLTKDFK